MKKGVVTGALSCVMAMASSLSAQSGPAQWTSNGAPAPAAITGGGWTLEQSGAAVGLKSAGYCDANGNQIGNPGTERMEPYYFPTISGHGRHLQGYFDWRPKDIDEAVAAAYSDDAGFTWTFQQKVLELRTTCPTNPQADPDGDSDYISPNNSDNGDDDGQGHQYIIRVGRCTYLYTLIRAAGYIDAADLAIHELHPQPGLPLNGVPAMSDAPTDQTPGLPEPSFHTNGLLNPDGILGVVPGLKPLTIIYEQKILSGDNTGTTALPASQQCITNWASYYKSIKVSPNDDITYLRLATTTDGVNFTDLGPLKGLNDPTTVALTGTRWLATAGTIMKLANGRYGLFYSGGNCVDADSDAFHFIGYAESSDLLNWTVVNGINNPIASIFSSTLNVDGDNIPTTGPGQLATIPANLPVVGNTQGFFAGRVYAPSAAQYDENSVTVVFAGYHTQKPKNGLGDYRTIGRVSLRSSVPLLAVGAGGGGQD
jgi:hypothetical protein